MEEKWPGAYYPVESIDDERLPPFFFLRKGHKKDGKSKLQNEKPVTIAILTFYRARQNH
ncbi:MAG: hypothetical protein K8R45_05725 [Desulfobacterales bacterium]|nr:hypothetical protein [Desulfobacterales bacterium]